MNEKIVLEGGILIDGTGKRPLKDSVVVIEGKKIVGVGKSGEIEIPSGSKVIDVSGRTVMPGLIDAHVHFSGTITPRRDVNMYLSKGLKLIRAVNDAKTLLNAGFTTCKDCGGPNGIDLRDAINEGTIPGPRILAAGLSLCPTFGHGDRQHLSPKWSRESNPAICDGVGECRKAVRLSFRAGADFIKVSSSGGVGGGPRDSGHLVGHTVEELKAIVEEAQKFKSFVTSHAQGTKGIKNAIVAGIKTIDHGDWCDDETCQMMIENGNILVTTLSTVYQNVHPKAGEYGVAPWIIKANEEKIEEYTENIKMAYDVGVTIALGTDFTGKPLKEMDRNAMELQLYVEKCGFDPMDAIVSATLNGAKACGLEDEIGTVEVGKKADIIVVDGNPLEDISIFQETEKIEVVMKEGVIYKNTII